METRIVIYSDQNVAQRLSQIIQDDEFKIVGAINDENKVLEYISKTKANMILIYSDNMNKVLRVCQQIYLLRPRTIPVVLTNNYTPEVIQQVIQTGVNNILPIQIDSNTLINRLKVIVSNESNRLLALENSSSKNYKSKVITFFSSKGGVGKTTTLTNLAIKLASKKKRVCILDFDLEFGEISSAMGIDSKKTIVELIEDNDSIGESDIRKYLAIHMSGVDVLPAPPSPEFADNISSESVEKIISRIRNYYDYILIDTKVGFNPVNLSCFDMSEMIMYITTPDVSSLRRTKKGLSILNSLVGYEKIKLCVGMQYPSRVGLKDVQKALETQLFYSIQYDHKLALESINLGIPVVQSAPTSKIAKSYEKLSNLIDSTESKKIEKVSNKKKGLNINEFISKLIPKKKK